MIEIYSASRGWRTRTVAHPDTFNYNKSINVFGKLSEIHCARRGGGGEEKKTAFQTKRNEKKKKRWKKKGSDWWELEWAVGIFNTVHERLNGTTHEFSAVFAVLFAFRTWKLRTKLKKWNRFSRFSSICTDDKLLAQLPHGVPVVRPSLANCYYCVGVCVSERVKQSTQSTSAPLKRRTGAKRTDEICSAIKQSYKYKVRAAAILLSLTFLSE